MFGPARRTWVLGGGGARGAQEVGVLQALFEAGVEGPAAVVGTSVGALNGSAIAAYPSLAGVMMLREVWMSRPALSVFQAHPIGLLMSSLRRDLLSAFPQDNVRRLIVRTQALTGITTFDQLRLPLAIAMDDGAKEIIAISLMAGGENEPSPTSFPELIARTLQLSLHHQMLSDYERLRDRAKMVVICPVTPPMATWEMKR